MFRALGSFIHSHQFFFDNVCNKMRIWPLNVIIENYDFYKSENITS
jgi:hypothetical protein